MNGCCRKWSKMPVTAFSLAVRSSSRTTMPADSESRLVYRNPPPPTPWVQSPTTARAAPSSPVRPNRASIVSRGSEITDFTPTARWFSGSFCRSPACLAMKEFTPSAATTTWARSSSSPARTPVTRRAVLGEDLVHPDAGHDHGAGLLALLGQPRVQLGAQHRDRVDRVGQPGVLVVDGDRAAGVEEA